MLPLLLSVPSLSPQSLQGLLVLPPLLLINGVQLEEQQAQQDEDYGSHCHQHLQCKLDTCRLGASTVPVPSKAVGHRGKELVRMGGARVCNSPALPQTSTPLTQD